MESERIGPDLCLASHTMIEAALTSFPPSKLLSNVRSTSANALQQHNTRVFTTQSYDPSHSRTTVVSVATTNRTMPSSPRYYCRTNMEFLSCAQTLNLPAVLRDPTEQKSSQLNRHVISSHEYFSFSQILALSTPSLAVYSLPLWTKAVTWH